MTAQDLSRLGEGDVRRELVNGEIVEMTPGGGRHGEITLRIGRVLAEHVERHGGGRVVVGDVGFLLRLPGDPERVRAPPSPTFPRPGSPRAGCRTDSWKALPIWRWKCSRRLMLPSRPSGRSETTSRPGLAWSGSSRRPPTLRPSIGRTARRGW